MHGRWRIENPTGLPTFKRLTTLNNRAIKKILIIYPHFPPSNLAGVHRARLFAQHLPSFGWEPVILTVNEKYYEEEPDYNLEKLLPASLRIEKVKAFRVTKPRLIGDIGLRAFFQLYKRAKQLIKTETFDFLYIPIPSFYCALLGRWLHESTRIKYGIDYIDPWVHNFPGSDKIFSRHWVSTKIARSLEPIAIKKASLITGVAEGYYKGVAQRNPHLVKRAIFGAMPYGVEKADHKKVKELDEPVHLFENKPWKTQLVYAGAMLPKAYGVLEEIFAVIKTEPALFDKVEFHFIGTGKRVDDPRSFNIKALAEKYGLWQTIVFEYPARIPYLDVLVHLAIADGAFILGSTEPHYTPSKVYQGILAGKPILAVLHEKSTASKVIEEAGAGKVLRFDGAENLSTIQEKFGPTCSAFIDFVERFRSSDVNQASFEKYSARAVTKQLAGLLDQVMEKK